MSRKTRLITETALLLALSIASQFLKNVSVYITGPIINCILIIAVLEVGLASGLIISVITPVTSFLITGSPIMKALPLVMPSVMIGNAVIVLMVWLIYRKAGKNLILALGAGTVLKAVVMGLLISVIIIPIMGPNTALPEMALNTARFTFSVTQLIAAAIGSVLAYIIWIPLKKARHNVK